MSRDAGVWWDVAVGLVFLSATLGGLLVFCAGIRVMLLVR
jgi:UPF0716 family protein affecting phage T7 exclusion